MKTKKNSGSAEESTRCKKRGRPAGKSPCECSCISYLSTESLKVQLDTLVLKGAIQHYWFVQHKPEKAETKLHHHVRLVPPAAQSVVWEDLCREVVEIVPGESAPRALVLYNGSVNDCWQDALLYARHASRYLALKGMTKQFVDYPISEFVSDSRDWLEYIWAESESFEPERKKLASEDVMRIIDEREGQMSKLDLLRIVLGNRFKFTDFQLFQVYCVECAKAASERKRLEEERSKREPMLPMEGL